MKRAIALFLLLGGIAYGQQYANYPVQHGGTVTSITAGTGLTSSPNPITGAGTISLSVPVTVPNGGTGDTSFTSNAVVVGNGTGPLAVLANNSTATNEFLTQSSSGAPSWAALLAADIPNISAAKITSGTLATSVGGTGTGTTFTTGSVVYADGSGNYAQDNANFFWDGTNHRLGIGTTTPANKLGVNGSVAIGTYAGTNTAPSNGIIVSGNVGIGTTSPLSALDINGGLAIGTYAGTNAAGSGNVIVSGNVGIGTTNPTQRVDLVSSTNNDYDGMLFRPLNLSQSLKIGWFGLSTTASLNMGTSGAAQIQFFTNGATKMTVDTGGNIGIGTIAPLNKLDVNGAAAIGTYAGVNTAPTNGLIVSGNVGIGSASPAAKLDVSGTVKLGTAGIALTAMGACTISSTTISTTVSDLTCTGVPASAAVAVICTGQAAFSTSTANNLYCRATGTLSQVECNTVLANTTAMAYSCSWIQP